jgi:lysyl-tRNA synthetase class 1
MSTPSARSIDPAQLKAWPFIEARRILDRITKTPPAKGYVLFETGYGPSGLPHIGTFGEVLRTSMVRRAFHELSDIPTRLIAFSDDLDGLRKVPDNVPNKDMLRQHLGKPLTSVPDPFGTHPSFGEHNNARLCAFLDAFGFDYEFRSATACYRSGQFDAMLLRVLENFDAIAAVVLPTLGNERRETYSPLLPICPRTGVVLQVPVVEKRVADGTIVYRDPETAALVAVPVTGGACKLQWKVDWAMRWAALQVDYEMSGKDLIDSVKLSTKICRILGETPPENLTYELFLDANGEKISKSKGNGLSLEDWLKYAPQQSLSYYMFQTPTRAKRLHFDVIPKAMDEYLTHLEAFPTQDAVAQLNNPVWHIHGGQPPASETSLSFSLLLNLAAAAHAEDKAVLWGFISRYAPEAAPETHPLLDQMAGFAVRYYQDFVKPTKQFRAPTEQEQQALLALQHIFKGLPDSVTAEEIQQVIYDIGMQHQFDPLRDWFKAIYEVLLGQSQGPRFGSFVKLYGLRETAAFIGERLEACNSL